jgi:hypothetical protein
VSISWVHKGGAGQHQLLQGPWGGPTLRDARVHKRGRGEDAVLQGPWGGKQVQLPGGTGVREKRSWGHQVLRFAWGGQEVRSFQVFTTAWLALCCLEWHEKVGRGGGRERCSYEEGQAC